MTEYDWMIQSGSASCEILLVKSRASRRTAHLRRNKLLPMILVPLILGNVWLHHFIECYTCNIIVTLCIHNIYIYTYNIYYILYINIHMFSYSLKISLVVLLLLRIIYHSYQLAIKKSPQVLQNFTKPAQKKPFRVFRRCFTQHVVQCCDQSLHPSIVQGADPGDSASAVRSALRAGTAAAAAASRSYCLQDSRIFDDFCLFRVFDTKLTSKHK